MGDIELQVFSERLKILRNSLGITQKDFAEKIGVTAAALSSYENNLKNPSIAVAKRIAETFNVSIDWLCGLTNKKTSASKIRTYKELFEYLLLLTECEGNFYLELDNFGGSSIVFADVSVRCFFQECGKMIRLLNEGSIDKEVYDFWLQKFLNTPEYSQNLKERKEDFFRKIVPPKNQEDEE